MDRAATDQPQDKTGPGAVEKEAVVPTQGAAPAEPAPPAQAPAPDAAPVEPPPQSPEQQRFEGLRQKAETSLALVDAQAARLSSLSGGIRFSSLQKTQYGLVSELRALRAQPPDEASVQGVESVIERADRLAATLGPAVRAGKSAAHEADPQGASGETAETGESPLPAVFANPGSLRQALIRGMILLAPAPLHLQIEFAPDFPLAEGDPLALAARSHAINRAALGSLRRIQWETPKQVSLWFGDGEQRRVVTASFDDQGKVELPPEFRQKHNPPGQGASKKAPAAAKPHPSQRQRLDLMGPPAPQRQRVELVGPPRPRVELVGPPRPRVELMGPPSPFARQRQGPRSGERPRRQRGGAPAGSQGASGTAPDVGTRGQGYPRAAQGTPADGQRQRSGERSGQQPGAPRQDGQQRREPRSGPPRSGSPRSGPPRSGPPRSGPPRSGPPRSGPPRSGPPGSGPPGSGPQGSGAGRPGQATTAGDRAPGAGGPRPQGPRRDQAPGGPRRDRDDRRERDDRQPRQGSRGGGASGGGSGSGGGFPANSMLADKLRAALAPVKAGPKEAPTAGDRSSDAGTPEDSPKKQ